MDNQYNQPNPSIQPTISGAQLPPPAIPSLPEKPNPRYSTADAAFAWICFALGFVFARYVTQFCGGLWGGIFWAAFGILTAAYARVKGLKTNIEQKVVFAVAEIFCLVPVFCASGFINSLAAWFSFLLLFYLCVTVSGAELFGKHFAADLFKSVAIRPFKSFGSAPAAAFSPVKRGKGIKNIAYVLIGLVIAVPLTLVSVGLLILSDGYFESIMRDFFSSLPQFSFSLIWQVIFGAIVGMFLFGALYSSGKPTAGYDPSAPAYRVLPAAVSYSAVTPVCVFYLVYIITQIRYLTGAVTGQLPEGFSVSEFARRGFFELCVVAVINLCVITVMLAFTARGEADRPKKALRIYTIVISVFTLLLISSAFSKMAFYIKSYGLTQLRVYTSWFMVVLAVVFVVIIIKQLAEIPMWRVLFISFTVMLALLCFSNLDGQIARYNINACRSGALKEIDLYSMAELNGMAAEPVAELVINSECSDCGISAEEADKFLAAQLYKMEQQNDFAYFSIPRLTAINAINKAGITEEKMQEYPPEQYLGYSDQ